MGHTGNMIIEDFMRQICVPLENNAYFGDGDGVDSNPYIWVLDLSYTSRYHLVTIIATLRWASCGPVPGPQDAQRRVVIIVTRYHRACPGNIAGRQSVNITLFENEHMNGFYYFMEK